MAKIVIIALGGTRTILTGELCNNISVAAAFESISRKVAKVLPPKKRKIERPKPGKHTVKGKPKSIVKKPVKKTGTKKPVVKKAPVKAKAIKLPEWWVKLSEKSKATYVSKHPASKFVKQVAAKNPALKKVLVQAQKKAGIDPHAPTGGVPEVAHEEKQDDSLDENAPKTTPPITPEEKAKKQQIRHKSLFHKAYFHAREKINHTLKAHRVGMKAVGKFLKGGNLKDKEKIIAKSWAGNAAKLVVGTLAVASLFTPLAGLGPQLGEHFLNYLRTSAVDSAKEAMSSDAGETKPVAESNPDTFEPTDFTDRLHDWLMEQDIPELIEKLKTEGTPT